MAHPVVVPRSSASIIGRPGSCNPLAGGSAGVTGRSRMMFITKAHEKWAFGFGRDSSMARWDSSQPKSVEALYAGLRGISRRFVRVKNVIPRRPKSSFAADHLEPLSQERTSAGVGDTAAGGW